jgi:hypothetical protein
MSIKKRGMLIIAIAIVLCLVPNISMADIKLSFKIHGGWSYLQAGDVNPGTEAFLDWGKSYYEIREGEYKALHHGYEVGGELIFELDRNFGVGLGAGFLRCSIKNQANGYQPDYGPSAVFLSKTELIALPVRVFAYLSIPLNRKLSFMANAGISYYLRARYTADWQEYDSVALSGVFWMGISTVAREKRNPFGLQGSLGIEYRLSKRIGLILLEAQGRWARFRGLEGTSVAEVAEGSDPRYTLFSETGKLYYESVPMISDAPRLIMIQSSPPNGPGGQPRQAVVDFSGFSLQAGFRFYF